MGSAFDDEDAEEKDTGYERWPDEFLAPNKWRDGYGQQPLRPDVRLGGSFADDSWFLYRPGELLVSLAVERQLLPYLRKRRARRVEWRCLLEGRGVDATGLVGDELGLAAYKLPPDQDLPEAVAALRQALDDESQHLIGPNHVLVGAQTYPSAWTDRQPAGQPPHQMYGAPHINGGGGGPAEPSGPPGGTWPEPPGTDGAGVDVTIVDTGYWRVRPSLLPPPRGDTGEIDADGDLELDRDAGHADFIWGLLFDAAPATVVRHRRALDSFGVGDDVGVATCILRSAGTDIYNLSLGGHTQGDQAPQAIVEALRLVDPSAVVVAAAGNGATERAFWPAALSTGRPAVPPVVVAVGAVKPDPAGGGGYVPAGFSNRGPWVTCSSRGVRRISTYVQIPVAGQRPADAWARWSGTSFATPIVAGSIAREASRRGVSARDAWSTIAGGGRRTLSGLGLLVFPEEVAP